MNALVCHSGLSLPTSISQAARSLDAAWEQLMAARDAWCRVAPGETDDLFDRTADWVAAVHEYDRRKLRLETINKQARGAEWLVAVVGGES
jgi:hypothetical protein